MTTLSESMISKIAWEAFSKYTGLALETVEDIALRVWIANELRKLEQLEGVSDEKIEEATDIIEATIVETPENIKKIEDNKEQEKAFKEYVKKNKYINNGTIQGVQHNEGTVNNYFGDVHNPPKS